MRFDLRISCMLVLAAPCALPAQGDREAVLTIRLDGLSSARVVEATPTGRRDLAQIVSAAPGNVLMSAVNAGKGERVRVLLDETASQPTLVLQPPGVRDPQCAARDSGGADACDEVAVLSWGRSATLSVNGIGGVINVITRQPQPRVTVGAEVTYNGFTSLEDVACAQAGLSACMADASGIGYGGFLEYQVTPRLRIGARYERTSYTVDMVNGTTVMHDVTLSKYETYGQFRLLDAGSVTPFGFLGWGWYVNDSELRQLEQVLARRDQGGGRIFGGIGADVAVGDRFGVRFSGGYGSGGSDDADNHFRATFGATLRF